MESFGQLSLRCMEAQRVVTELREAKSQNPTALLKAENTALRLRLELRSKEIDNLQGETRRLADEAEAVQQENAWCKAAREVEQEELRARQAECYRARVAIRLEKEAHALTQEALESARRFIETGRSKPTEEEIDKTFGKPFVSAFAHAGKESKGHAELKVSKTLI